MSDRSGSDPRTAGGSREPGWDNARWDGDSGRGAGAQGSASAPTSDRDAPLTRFLGGSPASVLVRLLIVSFVVGALMVWLDIHPMDIYFGLRRFFHRIWMLGFDSIREIGSYILAGAVIVVPVWIVLRLMDMRRR
jgi:hypothetical protein